MRPPPLQDTCCSPALSADRVSNLPTYVCACRRSMLGYVLSVHALDGTQLTSVAFKFSELQLCGIRTHDNSTWGRCVSLHQKHQRPLWPSTAVDGLKQAAPSGGTPYPNLPPFIHHCHVWRMPLHACRGARHAAPALKEAPAGTNTNALTHPPLQVWEQFHQHL
jgi:hypothetical protein